MTWYLHTGDAVHSAENSLAAVATVDRWNGQTDRRTDGQTPDRYIHPAPHTMRAAKTLFTIRKLKTFVAYTEEDV